MPTVAVIEGYGFKKWKQTHRGELIKLSKQLIQQLNQFLGCALRGQAGETNYICKQDAVTEERNGSQSMSVIKPLLLCFKQANNQRFLIAEHGILHGNFAHSIKT